MEEIGGRGLFWGTVLAFAWRDCAKTTKNFGEDARYLEGNLNPRPPDVNQECTLSNTM
jgi:hypothetical protein